MSDLLELLKQFLPVEIAIIAAIFVYLLLLFKGIAEKFISIAEKQTEQAETQTQYIQQRLDVVEKYLGISDKAIDLRDRHIQKLEELAIQRETEIARSQKALDEAKGRLRTMEQRYQEAVATLNLQSQQVKKLQEAQRHLEQASRTEVVAQITHELQTRLQAIIAHAENLTLEAGELSRREVSSRTSDILYAALGLDTLLKNLVQDMTGYHFRGERIDRLLFEAERIYQGEATHRNVEILTDLQPVQGEMPTIEISRYHLQIALNNLIHNAIKYSFRGSPGRRRYVHITGGPADKYYAISITNYGVGILPEEIESGAIFEDGYQGRLTQGEYRTGLGRGLSYAKRVIDRHHGFIEVESNLIADEENPEDQPHLTRFVVYLPYSQPSQE